MKTRILMGVGTAALAVLTVTAARLIVLRENAEKAAPHARFSSPVWAAHPNSASPETVNADITRTESAGVTTYSAQTSYSRTEAEAAAETSASAHAVDGSVSASESI